jgi:hypothetical protein
MSKLRADFHSQLVSYLAAFFAVPGLIWIWLARHNIDLFWWYWVGVIGLLIYISVWLRWSFLFRENRDTDEKRS